MLGAMAVEDVPAATTPESVSSDTPGGWKPRTVERRVQMRDDERQGGRCGQRGRQGAEPGGEPGRVEPGRNVGRGAWASTSSNGPNAS